MNCVIREIRLEDNPAISQVIHVVSAEFGLTGDSGFAVADPEVDHMYQAYSGTGAAYWVVEKQGEVLGGGGIAPLKGGNGQTAELQKMYFLPECRGLGLGYRITQLAITFAEQHGFEECYLETTANLKAAIRLYQSLGFETLRKPMGCTGHSACEISMLKKFEQPTTKNE